MGGWLRYLTLKAQVSTGLNSQILIWAVIAVIAAVVTFVFLLVAAFLWLSDLYDGPDDPRIGLDLEVLTGPMASQQLFEAIPFYTGLTLDEIGGKGVRWQERPEAEAYPTREQLV